MVYFIVEKQNVRKSLLMFIYTSLTKAKEIALGCYSSLEDKLESPYHICKLGQKIAIE